MHMIVQFQDAEAFTLKPVLNSHSKEDPKYVSKTDNCLMQVKSIAECSMDKAMSESGKPGIL